MPCCTAPQTCLGDRRSASTARGLQTKAASSQTPGPRPIVLDGPVVLLAEDDVAPTDGRNSRFNHGGRFCTRGVYQRFDREVAPRIIHWRFTVPDEYRAVLLRH